MAQNSKKYHIIDAHCHIYPDKIAVKASESTGHFYGISMYADGTVATLIEKADKAGIDRCLIHSVATSPKQVSSINHFIADSVTSGNGRFIGFGALHPDSEDMAADVNEVISLGLLGVKVHPDIQGIAADDERFMKMYEELEGKLPLLIHCGDKRYDMSNANRIERIVDSFPKLTVICAHFGGYSVWEDSVKVLAGKPNVYVDTCSSMPFLTDEKIRKYISAYGEDRVLFGTDYPMWEGKSEVDRLLSLGLSEQTLEGIFHANLEKLLGI